MLQVHLPFFKEYKGEESSIPQNRNTSIYFVSVLRLPSGPYFTSTWHSTRVLVSNPNPVTKLKMIIIVKPLASLSTNFLSSKMQIYVYMFGGDWMSEVEQRECWTPLGGVKEKPSLGSLGGSVIQRLRLAQVMVPGSWDRALHRAPCSAGSLLLSLFPTPALFLTVSVSLSLILINKIFKKIKINFKKSCFLKRKSQSQSIYSNLCYCSLCYT